METIKQQLVSSVAQAPLDNFGRFNDSVEGANDDGHGASILNGIRLKFTNEARWETPDGDDFTDRELVAINVRRVEVRWGESGKPPKDWREVAPGEQFRDLTALNESIPKSEWREGFDGNLKGPWERQYILEFVNLDDMQRYSFPTSTIGGFRCIRELDDRVKLMRRYRGENVYPKARLTHTHMPTRYGGRERPHCEITDWIKIGGGEAEAVSPPQAPLLPPEQEQATPPPPQQEQIAPEASPPQAQAVSQAETLKIQPVSEPTLQEELNDKVPF
jgi:hypothetical protein